MKQQTTEIIRDMLAGRIGWLSDQIRKGPENAAALAAELAKLSEALADLVIPVPIPAPTMDQVRGPELYRVFRDQKQTVTDLAQHLAQSVGKTHPFVMLIKQARAVAFDPYAGGMASPITEPVTNGNAEAPPAA